MSDDFAEEFKVWFGAEVGVEGEVVQLGAKKFVFAVADYGAPYSHTWDMG